MTKLPGEPLTDGFTYYPASSPYGRLTDEAIQRINDKIDAVNAARRRATAASKTAVIGGT